MEWSRAAVLIVLILAFAAVGIVEAMERCRP